MISLKNLSAITLVVSFFLSACQKNHHSFSTDEKELIRLVEESAYVNEFIDKWDLELCFSNEFSKRYCYQDSLIVFELFNDESYFLSLTNVDFQSSDDLIKSLSDSYEYLNLLEMESAEKHIGQYNLDKGYYYFNQDYEFIIGKKETSNRKLFIVSVSKSI